MCEYYQDVLRNIKKFDIYQCDFEDHPDTNMIGKVRPGVILSSDEINCFISNSFIVAPIKTEHSMEATEENTDEIVKMRRELGQIVIPIRMNNRISFIDITQMRQMDAKLINRYIGTIANDGIRRQINSSLMELLFSKDESIYEIPVTSVRANRMKFITSSNQAQNEQNDSENIEIVELQPVSPDSEMGKKLNKAIKSKENEQKVIEFYKQVQRKELSKSTAAHKLGLTIKEFDKIVKEIKKEEKENKGPSKYSMRSLPKTLPAGFSMFYKAHKEGRMTVKEMSTKLGKSDQTIYNYIARYEQLQEENKERLTSM